MASEEMLFVKDEASNSIALHDEDVWDDTELIRLYDKSVAKLKNKTNNNNNNNNKSNNSQTEGSERDNLNSKQKKRKSKKKKNKSSSWQVGDDCLALYYVDNLYYEASILSVDNNKNVATVKFSYYLNEETVHLKNLLSPECKSRMEVCEGTRANEEDEDEDVDEPRMLHEVSEMRTDFTVSSEEDSDVSSTVGGAMHHQKGEWRVSDLCYVLSRKGVYHRAVVNSFVGTDQCVVTFTKTNTKGHAKMKQLHRKLPRTEQKKRARSRTSSAQSHQLPSIPTFSMPDLRDLPPLPPLPAGMPLPPPFPSINNNNTSPWSNYFPPGASCLGASSTTAPTAPPPCPAPPVISGDILAGSEEALANMLMSWYISGFHTGYYQGKQQQQQQFPPPPVPHGVGGSTSQRGRSESKKSKRYHDRAKVSNV